MNWETVIGIEVHVQLDTASKIFSGASTAYGAMPNTQACGIDIALPGVLPVLNKKAVEYAIRFGLSVNAEINKRSIFARKNYFYPDLPKGYQISQHSLPVIGKGYLDIQLEDGSTKRVGITRAHLEEDAGKSLHGDIPGFSGIDLNRAGTPLLEIVSEPDLRNAKEAIAYLKALHALVTYLGICDGNMQEGSFRADINVSLRRVGTHTFGTRTETKNVNSFRFAERAILYEIERQKEILESGGTIVQETRLYDADKDITRAMRSKENAHDYRYFPEPDLLPLEFSDSFITKVRQDLPELPWEKRERFIHKLELSNYDAEILTHERALADYFEATHAEASSVPAKTIANWIIGEVNAFLNKDNITIHACPITPTQLAQLLSRIQDKTISNTAAKKVFEVMWAEKDSVDSIIAKLGLTQISDSSALEKIIDTVLANSPEQIAQYKSGKDKLFGYFVGQVMKETKGKADPQLVNDLLKARLG